MSEGRYEVAGRFLVFDVGCIECGESSRVVGFYPTLDEAEAAMSAYSNPEHGGTWGRAGWSGQHSVEVYDLTVAGVPA